MADIYLLPSDQTSAQSRDELRSATTLASASTKVRISNALETLSNKETTPERTLEASRELAGGVFQQLREQKLKPHEFKAVLNDVPAHARGPVEDALKSVQITPTYLAPKENNQGFDVVNSMTDKASKRPNPVPFSPEAKPVDLKAMSAIQAENSAKEPTTVAAVLQETGNTRTLADIRSNIEQVAASAKAHLDQAGVPEGSRGVVVNAPPHLTGALETALERKGIATFHPNEKTGELQRGASAHSGAEQRGLQAVRDGFGTEGKGVSDNQIRQAVGSDRLQALGQDPKVLNNEAIQKVLDNRPETLTEVNRRVDAVLETAKTVELKTDVNSAEKAAEKQKDGPLKVEAADSARTVTVTMDFDKKSVPSIDTRARGPEGAAPAPTKSQIGADMLRSYIVEATPDSMKAKSVSLQGMTGYIGVQKLSVAPATERDISKHIEKATLESFARDGVPHRELESLNAFLSARAAQTGAKEMPDRLDAAYFRQVAMDLKSDPSIQVRHEGKVIGNVAEIRQELSKVNALEAKSKEQLREVLPEKGFDSAMKQLDLRTIQHIADKGIDRALVEQVKAQLNEKLPANSPKFKTTDALNAISAAKSELSGKQLVGTSLAYDSKNEKFADAAVMLKVSDLRNHVERAEKSLGREPGPEKVSLTTRKEPTLGPDPALAAQSSAAKGLDGIEKGATPSAATKALEAPEKAQVAEAKPAVSEAAQTKDRGIDSPEKSLGNKEAPTQDTGKENSDRNSESQRTEQTQQAQQREQPQREASFERTR